MRLWLNNVLLLTDIHVAVALLNFYMGNRTDRFGKAYVRWNALQMKTITMMCRECPLMIHRLRVTAYTFFQPNAPVT